MQQIRLNKSEWYFDEGQRLGAPGGFGDVFLGQTSDGKQVAVKRLQLTAGQAAHRELQIGKNISNRTFRNVVPVLDYGQDSQSDRYFIVMPVCDESLQDRMRGDIQFEEVKIILLDIVDGLREVENIVHRDLKPGNVLRHEGRWKIADFGIAKFVEDSTSLLTLRDALTPIYGAPEQWRGERPTAATDVYALGCIAIALMNGAPPFGGSADDIRDGHLHASPPTLRAPPALAALVSQMLRKSPEGRPTLERVRLVLSGELAKPVSAGGRAALAAAAQRISTEKAQAEAAKLELQVRAERWRALGREALEEFEDIKQRLLGEVLNISGDAVEEDGGVVWGRAAITFYSSIYVPYSDIDYHSESIHLRREWEVAASCVVGIETVQDNGERYLPGATFFFGKKREEGQYRWHEVSFWSRGGENNPIGLPLGNHNEIIKMLGGHSNFEIAFGPTPIDGEDEADFQDRWFSLIARAAMGNLRRPGYMPPPRSFFYGE